MQIFYYKKYDTGSTFETKDPRNGEVIANIAEGREEDVDLAVKVARQAFDFGPWPRLPGCVSFSFSALYNLCFEL